MPRISSANSGVQREPAPFIDFHGAEHVRPPFPIFAVRIANDITRRAAKGAGVLFKLHTFCLVYDGRNGAGYPWGALKH